MSIMEKARALRAAMDRAGAFLTDEQALGAKELYPRWESLAESGFTAEEKGLRFRYGDALYKTAQPGLGFQPQWVPGQGTESLYTHIDESHAGTLDDPIPYSGNMELVQDLYYSQYGLTYLCTRSSGSPLHNPLEELVGIYVEALS